MHPIFLKAVLHKSAAVYTIVQRICGEANMQTMARKYDGWLGTKPNERDCGLSATHDPQADLREAGEGTMQSRWHAQRFRLFRHVCKTVLQTRDGLNGWTLRSLLLRRQCPGGKTPRNEEKVWHVMTRQKKVVRRKEEDEDGFRHLCYNYFIQVYNYLSAWV